jgi:single-strand DNA-binding protein
MTGYNRVVLVGNLTRDPQLKATPANTPVAEMGLATNERYKNRDGEAVEKTCFVDIQAWGRQAETCCQYLAKGAPVLVEGRLQYDSWQKPDGQRRSKLRVRADRVAFLGRKQDGPTAPPSDADKSSAATATEDGDNLPF